MESVTRRILGWYIFGSHSINAFQPSLLEYIHALITLALQLDEVLERNDHIQSMPCSETFVHHRNED